MIGEGDTPVVTLLVSAIVALAGAIAWSVRFFANKLFGNGNDEGAVGKLTRALVGLRDEVHGMRGDLKENTQTQRDVQSLQREQRDAMERFAKQAEGVLDDEPGQNR